MSEAAEIRRKKKNEKRSRLIQLIKERAEKRQKAKQQSAGCVEIIPTSIVQVPLSDKMYTYHRMFFDALNQTDFDKLRVILATYCTEDIILSNIHDGGAGTIDPAAGGDPFHDVIGHDGIIGEFCFIFCLDLIFLWNW